MPVLGWAEDLDIEWGSNIWLVKAREPSVAEEWLTMREDINALICINVSVKSCTVVNICVYELEINLVNFAFFE